MGELIGDVHTHTHKHTHNVLRPVELPPIRQLSIYILAQSSSRSSSLRLYVSIVSHALVINYPQASLKLFLQVFNNLSTAAEAMPA